MTIEAAWTDIEQTPPSQRGELRRRLPTSQSFDIFAAVAFPSGALSLLVGVPSEASNDISPFRTKRLRFELDADSGLLRLALDDPSFRDLFAVLATDLVARLEQLQDPADGVRLLSTRARRWRDLLARGRGLLSEQEQIGLMAELLVLEGLIDRGMDETEAVQSWVGPEGAGQDFVTETGSIETKATGDPHALIHIASLHQLDPAAASRLALLRHVLKVSPAGTTLPTEVLRIADRLGIAREAFLDRVHLAGLIETDMDKYAQTFKLVGSDGWRVDDSFPSLTPAKVHPAIPSARYQLSPPALDAWRIGGSEESINWVLER
jgi:hypothetical protein